jgi:hypothetical protein
MRERNVITKSCIIRQNKVIINNQLGFALEDNISFSDFIKSVYNNYHIDYPKFFKMDNISKLGFLTGELLLKDIDLSQYHKEDIGVVMANSSSSLDTDEKYFETIKNASEYFPSPSLFVYTLPNIMIGELCIKYKLQGENALFVFDHFNMDFISSYVDELMNSNRIQSCIAGWIDLYHDKFESILIMIEKENRGNQTFISEHSSENIKKLYSNKI